MKDTIPSLSSWLSPVGWQKSKVTIFLWSRGRHCMVACSCQAAQT